VAWRGAAVKVLAPRAASRIPPRLADTVILWLHRNPIEQAQSSVKMAAACGITLEEANVARLYAERVAVEIFDLERCAPVVQLHFAVLLGWDGPAHLAEAVGRALDLDAMRAVVHARTPAPREDLALELDLAERYGAPTSCLCGQPFTVETLVRRIFRVCDRCAERLGAVA
jgi:hypothetical protein